MFHVMRSKLILIKPCSQFSLSLSLLQSYSSAEAWHFSLPANAFVSLAKLHICTWKNMDAAVGRTRRWRRAFPITDLCHWYRHRPATVPKTFLKYAQPALDRRTRYRRRSLFSTSIWKYCPSKQWANHSINCSNNQPMNKAINQIIINKLFNH